MRRLVIITSVVALLGAATAIVAGATSASAAGAKVTPGSIWTLQTPTSCQSDSFTTTHAFTTALNYGTGDRGRYSGTKKVTMTWTGGAASGDVFKGSWHKSTGAYTGIYTHAGTSDVATLDPASSVGCPTILTTPTTQSMALGATDADNATVSGADQIAPTGTVSFYVCGPTTTPTDCTVDTGTALGTPVDLGDGSGNIATAASAPYAPPTTGTYCFLGVYSGDGIYRSATDGSSTDECFTVTATGSGVTTAPSLSTIVLGAADADVATVTGNGGDVAPTGTVTFFLCGPQASAVACNVVNPTAITSGNQLGQPASLTQASATTATATSDPVTPLAVGTYCFVSIYSGDANFRGALDASPTSECFTVTPATPTVTSAPSSSTIVLGATDSDGATVTGVNPVTPTGTVHFWVCPDETVSCSSSSSGAIDLGSGPVSGPQDSGPATVGADSVKYTPPTAGSYCFDAVYSGDGNYASAADGSSDECFTVTSNSAAALALSSPENSFGTGALALGAGSPTHIWAAVNGYCTAKENGDEFLSAFDGTWTGDGWECSDATTPETPNATTNVDYNGADGPSAGYSYDIVTPPSASGQTDGALTVQAYDPAYQPTQCAGQPAVTNADPFNPAGGQTPDVNAGGPDTSITTDYTLTYAPVAGNDGDDTPVASYVAPSGDPTTCGQWATLFTIAAGSPDGFYRVQVTTPEAPGQDSDGVNAYSLRVDQGDSFARCSSRASASWYSPDCPVLSAQSALSTFVDEAGSSGSFYLAQVPATDAGGTMDVNLFDPGEGDKNIEIIDPDGNVVPFTWATADSCPLPAPDGASTDCAQDLGFSPLDGSGTALDVSGTVASPPGQESNSEFNDRLVQLAVAVPDDYAADNGGWWQIRYTSTNGTVQDRVTWSVALTGPTADQTPVSETVRHGPTAPTHAGRRHRRSATVRQFPAT